MKKTFFSLSTLLALIALVGCTSKPQQMAMPMGEYAMESISLSDCEIEQFAPTTLRGKQDVAVFPQVAGTLTQVLVEEGQSVKKGQKLFVIDQVPYEAALATAEAAMANAEATLATAKLNLDSRRELFEADVVSQFDLTTAENNLLMAKAGLEQARAALVNAQNNLSYTTVLSPCDGVLSTIPFRVGALVGPTIQEPLTEISDNSLMQAYFSMNESDLLNLIRKFGSREKALKNMGEVELILSDGEKYDKKGKVASFSGVIDPMTGTISVRADFPNPNGLLHSGATGQVLLTTQMNDVVVIPQSATFQIQDKFFANIYVDSLAKSNVISVKRLNDSGKYIVTSGLKVGDILITEGAGMIRPGTKVGRKKAQSAAANPAAAAAQKPQAASAK